MDLPGFHRKYAGDETSHSHNLDQELRASNPMALVVNEPFRAAFTTFSLSISLEQPTSLLNPALWWNACTVRNHAGGSNGRHTCCHLGAHCTFDKH